MLPPPITTTSFGTSGSLVHFKMQKTSTDSIQLLLLACIMVHAEGRVDKKTPRLTYFSTPTLKRRLLSTLLLTVSPDMLCVGIRVEERERFSPMGRMSAYDVGQGAL